MISVWYESGLVLVRTGIPVDNGGKPDDGAEGGGLVLRSTELLDDGTGNPVDGIGGPTEGAVEERPVWMDVNMPEVSVTGLEVGRYWMTEIRRV